MKFKTEGLIIGERPGGEKGRQVTVLTRDTGALAAFVYQSKRKGNGRAAGTDLLCYSRLDIYAGRGSYIIDGARPLQKFRLGNGDLSGAALAMYFCSMAAELVTEEEKSGEPLRLLLNALHFLEGGARAQALLKATVELRLLSETGYRPDLVACAGCGAYEARAMYFDPGDGVLRCESCHGQDGRRALMLSPAALRAMRQIIYADFERIFAFQLTGEALDELAAAAEAYALYILQKPPLALEMYRAVLPDEEHG